MNWCWLGDEKRVGGSNSNRVERGLFADTTPGLVGESLDDATQQPRTRRARRESGEELTLDERKRTLATGTRMEWNRQLKPTEARSPTKSLRLMMATSPKTNDTGRLRIPQTTSGENSNNVRTRSTIGRQLRWRVASGREPVTTTLEVIAGKTKRVSP